MRSPRTDSPQTARHPPRHELDQGNGDGQRYGQAADPHRENSLRQPGGPAPRDFGSIPLSSGLGAWPPRCLHRWPAPSPFRSWPGSGPCRVRPPRAPRPCSIPGRWRGAVIPGSASCLRAVCPPPCNRRPARSGAQRDVRRAGRGPGGCPRRGTGTRPAGRTWVPEASGARRRSGRSRPGYLHCSSEVISARRKPRS